MASGLSANVDLKSTNQQVGTRLQLVVKALSEIHDYKTNWLDPNGAAGLTALGMATDDVNNFFAAVHDCDNLYLVLTGAATVTGGAVTAGAGGYNFMTFISKCIGLGVEF